MPDEKKKEEDKDEKTIPSPVPTTSEGIPYLKGDGSTGYVIWNEQKGEYEDAED